MIVVNYEFLVARKIAIQTETKENEGNQERDTRKVCEKNSKTWTAKRGR